MADFDRNGAKALVKEKDAKGLALRKGSLVNDLLFGNVDFNELYTLKLNEDPANTLLKLANIIIDNYVKIPPKEEILEIIKHNGLWSNTKKIDKVIENFDRPEFWEYLDIKFAGDEKMLITPSVLAEAEEIVHILRTHEHSRHFFKSHNYELISEYPFKITYKDKVNFRGVVDMILIDHVNKTFRIVDLKTGAKKYKDFYSSLLEYRYYLQEGVYMLASDYIKEQLKVSDYRTLPFQFLFIGVNEKIPVIYEVDENLHNGAIKGFKTAGGYSYKGIDKLVDEILYHHKHKIYELDYDTVVNKGVLKFRDVYVE